MPRLFLARLKYLLPQVNDPVLLLSCSTFEYYPLVSRRCLAIAPHLTNSVKVMSFLVIITLRVLGCCQPRTPTSEIILHYTSNTPSILLGNSEPNLVILRLSAASWSYYLGLCYLVLLWCTNSSVCEHDLRRAFSIMLLV